MVRKVTQSRRLPETKGRLPYQPPKLLEFGSVSALTQAGTGTRSELMSNGMLSMSANQQRP